MTKKRAEKIRIERTKFKQTTTINIIKIIKNNSRKHINSKTKVVYKYVRLNTWKKAE